MGYPLVMTNIAIENGPVEIVDFSINSMVDLSSSLCNKLPGRVDTVGWNPRHHLGRLGRLNTYGDGSIPMKIPFLGGYSHPFINPAILM